MTNKEKIVAAFLVSMGLFSAKYAVEYVGSLSSHEKTELFMLSKTSGKNILLASGSPSPTDTSVQETKTRVS